MFVLGFFLAEFIVDHLLLYRPLHRFIARVAFQLQYYGLVYLIYDTREMSRKLRRIEKSLYGEAPGSGEEEALEKEGTEYE